MDKLQVKIGFEVSDFYCSRAMLLNYELAVIVW